MFSTAEIITFVIPILSLLIAGSAYFNNRKADISNTARKNATVITKLEEKVNNLQSLVNAVSIAEISSLKQSVDDLKQRFDKLDSDVEAKIDKVNEKLDKLLIFFIDKNNNQNVKI